MSETPTSRIWLDDGGILHMKLLPGAVLTLDEVKLNTGVVHLLAGGKRRPVFIDISEVSGITREARQYSASESVNDVLTALAILVNSPLTKTLGNLWYGINKPVFPSMLLISKEDVLMWLAEFLD